jgi:hypothetical protein
MSFPQWISTANAEANFVVANTPNFLIRKMRDDPAALALSQSLNGQQILEIFKSCVSSEPTSMRELVIPYICLSALSRKENVSYLVAATAFMPTSQFKWMTTYNKILVETYRPVSRQVFQVPAVATPISVFSGASTNRQILQVR